MLMLVKVQDWFNCIYRILSMRLVKVSIRF